MKQIFKYSFILILIDQMIKILVSNMIESIVVIKNFLNLTYVENTGAAFSMLENNTIFLIIITIVTLFLIYKFLLKNKQFNKLEITTYSLLIGGIIGNLIDRIIFGYVIDYLSFNFGEFYFPIFNFADICIVVAALIILIKTIKESLWK